MFSNGIILSHTPWMINLQTITEERRQVTKVIETAVYVEMPSGEFTHMHMHINAKKGKKRTQEN